MDFLHPFDKLPSIYNPPLGIIATANGRITPDGYPNSVSMEWEAPWPTADCQWLQYLHTVPRDRPPAVVPQRSPPVRSSSLTIAGALWQALL